MGKIKRITFLRTPVIYPPGSNRVNAPLMPPLGMAIITSALKKARYILEQDDLNIKVAHNNYYSKKKIDLNKVDNSKKVIEYLENKTLYYDCFIKEMLSKTKINNPDLILLSAPNSLYDQSAIRILLILCKYLKKEYHTPIIVGSESDHIHNVCKFAIENKLFDFMISGSGEKSILKIIEAIENKGNLRRIPGLCYLDKNKMVYNNEGKPNLKIEPDFKGLPLKFYEWYPNSRKNKGKGMLIIPYRFLYGCPNNCAFCIASKNKYVELLNHKKAVKTIKKLSQKYNSRYFVFLNDYFNISKEYAKNFCKELIKQKVKILWSDCAHENNIDEELLELMKKSGCIRIIFGFETGSERLLRLMNKRLSLGNLSKMLEYSHDIGIWNGVEIIAGLPTETKNDISKTIKFLKKNEEYIDEMYINRFRLIRGSALAKNPQGYSLDNLKFKFGNELIKTDNYFDVAGAEYDERDSLKWEDKKKMIINSERLIKKNFKKKSFILTHEQLNILFYIYSRYSNKEEIRNEYSKIINKKYRKMLLNMNSLIWQTRNLGSARFIADKIINMITKK